MNFIKNTWSLSDIDEFDKYLYSIKNNEKIAWTANIINTNMPVLAIKLLILKDISKEIYKGNYEAFLDIMPHKYFEDTIVCAFIIGFIKYRRTTIFIALNFKFSRTAMSGGVDENQ